MCNPQEGKTAMNIAVEKGHKDIVQVLETSQSKVRTIDYTIGLEENVQGVSNGGRVWMGPGSMGKFCKLPPSQGPRNQNISSSLMSHTSMKSFDLVLMHWACSSLLRMLLYAHGLYVCLERLSKPSNKW